MCVVLKRALNRVFFHRVSERRSRYLYVWTASVGRFDIWASDDLAEKCWRHRTMLDTNFYFEEIMIQKNTDIEQLRQHKISNIKH